VQNFLRFLVPHFFNLAVSAPKVLVSHFPEPHFPFPDFSVQFWYQ